jgi:hypothetical protein
MEELDILELLPILKYHTKGGGINPRHQRHQLKQSMNSLGKIKEEKEKEDDNGPTLSATTIRYTMDR